MTRCNRSHIKNKLVLVEQIGESLEISWQIRKKNHIGVQEEILCLKASFTRDNFRSLLSSLL